jgi:very-short-patch-repair endonuclease
MDQLHTHPAMKDRRKELRRNMTVAEKALWQMIRNEQLGFKFRRQHSVSSYVLDFYCAPLKLAIEVDGSTHLDKDVQLRDKIRQRELESHNITFVRVTDPQVLHDATYVLRAIKDAIQKLSHTT